MCDEHDLEQFAAGGVTRRGFAATGALAGLAACTSMEGTGSGSGPALTETMVEIPTADGTMDAFFVHPAKPAPAVILWPDIAGLRDAKKAMARRLAAEGYAVLVANPYYRDVRAPQYAQRAVNTKRGIGNQGYCMGGPYTVYTAAAVPGRVKAAASFHGGGLVSDKPNSPHLMLQKGTRYLFAIAQNDDAKQPEAKTMLRQAADTVGCAAEIEVYPADHGWCVPDSPVYNREQAERAWSRLLALYAQL
jgi:carboxymethylenebutenolidase